MPEEYLDPTDSVAVPRGRPAAHLARRQDHHPVGHLQGPGQPSAGSSGGAPADPDAAKAIVRKRKPTFARPAPAAPREEIVAGTDVLVEALAD